MSTDDFIKKHCSGRDANSLTMWRVWQFMTGSATEQELAGKWHSFLTWPPDVFALCAVVLRRSGCYTKALGNDACPIIPKIQARAKEWRRWFAKTEPCATRSLDPPAEIALCWTTLWKCRNGSLSRIVESNELMRILILMTSASDLASKGSGLPIREFNCGADKDDIDEVEGAWRLISHGWKLLEPTRRGSSLCSDRIHPNAARVLPKMHVASSGLTLRSFSHHLALCESDEVQPRWFMIPGCRGDKGNEHHVNLVVLPWPLEIEPAQFQVSKSSGGDGDAYFDYRSRPSDRVADVIDGICDEAERMLGSLDGVVMPELALDASEYETVRKRVLARKLMLVAGVGREPVGDRLGVNEVCVDVPLSQNHAVHFRQAKHHRWKLDRNQIVTYGIGARLAPNRSYWENIDVGDRRLIFLVLRPWFVASVLICEDLARHDPVGELLRGVGPHLVAALLMDGPQLTSRWSSRYATALADDPGTSVLSVSSLGMVGLSRPVPTAKRSRTVALWKDANRGVKELSVPRDAKALAITLSVENVDERSADGRTEKKARPVLTGVHPVKGDTELQRCDPNREPDVRFIAPNEAVDLARLAQQLKGPDKSPEVLMELTGEARAIGLEVWRIITGQPASAEIEYARKHPDDFAALAKERHTNTADAICRWLNANLES